MQRAPGHSRAGHRGNPIGIYSLARDLAACPRHCPSCLACSFASMESPAPPLMYGAPWSLSAGDYVRVVDVRADRSGNFRVWLEFPGQQWAWADHGLPVVVSIMHRWELITASTSWRVALDADGDPAITLNIAAMRSERSRSRSRSPPPATSAGVAPGPPPSTATTSSSPTDAAEVADAAAAASGVWGC